MSTKTTDRRILRTRQSLRDALFALMNDHDYASLSVQQIADTANVARATFYLHYTDKEELLVDAVEGLFRELTDSMEVTTPDVHAVLARALSQHGFEHVARYRSAYLALLNGPVSQRTVDRFQELIANIVRQQLAQTVDSPLLEPVAYHTAGALLALMRWWLVAGMPATAEEMAELHERLVVPGIAQLLIAKDNE